VIVLDFHAWAQTLADRGLGDMFELLVAAAIIIVSMLGGVISKIAQKYQQQKEDEAPRPARKPSPTRQPVSRERPDRAPRPARPPRPKPARPVVPARPAAKVETPTGLPRRGPVYRTAPTRRPAVARRPASSVDAQVIAAESPPREPLSTLTPTLPAEEPRRPPREPIARVVGQISLPQNRLREAVIFRELIDRPVGLRDDQLWWPHSYR